MKNFEQQIHIRSDISLNKKGQVVEHIKNSVQKDLIKANKNSFTPEQVLGMDARKKIERVYSIVKTKYKERGVENINLTEEIVFSKQNAIEAGTMAHHRGFVELFDLDIGDRNIKELVILKSLGHELYHSAAKASFDLKIKDNNITYQHKNTGAGYSEGEARAIEEGAAVIFEMEVFKEIEKTYPNETRYLYNKIIAPLSKNLDRGEIGHLNIVKYDTETSDASISENIPYKNSKILTQYLKDKIPNFNTLLEKARIHRHTLDLTRAVEKEFGSGMYRKIMTCAPDDAESLLNELREIKNEDY
jgi:hypothetical protein